LKPQLLLELQGTHGSDRFEVMVEAGDTHAQLAGDVFDPQWLVKVLPQSIDSSGNVVSVATRQSAGADPLALLAAVGK
jgi:hypothetical protein